MVMYPVTFESIDKQLSLIPNETATDITITKPTKTVTRFPTAEELEQLRKEGVDIEAIKGKKLVFPEGYETPTNIPLVNPFELDEGASKAEQRANHPK